MKIHFIQAYVCCLFPLLNWKFAAQKIKTRNNSNVFRVFIFLLLLCINVLIKVICALKWKKNSPHHLTSHQNAVLCLFLLVNLQILIEFHRKNVFTHPVLIKIVHQKKRNYKFARRNPSIPF